MNRKTTVWLLGLVVLVLAAGGFFAMSQGSSDPGCRHTTGDAHTVVISNSKPSTSHVYGKLCDTLTFRNKDDITREIAFGNHDHHVPYDGVAEKVLNQNQSFTVTLNQVGTFHWHDHEHDEVEGYFTVSK